MKCKSCDAEVNLDSLYCPKCGVSLREGEGAKPVNKAADQNPRRDSAEQSSPAKKGNGAGKDRGREVNLWEGGYSARAMIGSWIGGIVLSVLLAIGAIALTPFLGPIAWIVFAIVVAVIWVGLALLLAYRKLSCHYRLTNYRFIHRFGVLSQVTDRIEVLVMDDVSYTQGLIERFVNVGTIKIVSSDNTHPELTMPGIKKVEAIADMIDEARRKERQRRRVHMSGMYSDSGVDDGGFDGLDEA